MRLGTAVRDARALLEVRARVRRGEIWRRVYELKVGSLRLVALCDSCAAELPRGGVAESEFKALLECRALAAAAAGGRA